MDKDETFQPKSLLIHEPDFISNLQRLLGVINFDMAYDNFFSGASLAYDLTYLVEDAITQKNIKLKGRDDLLPDVDVIYKIRKIWNGHCFITIENEDPTTELFHYDSSKIDINNSALEIISLPALSNMTPIGQLKEDTLFIEIHESIPCKYAWQGLTYANLIGDGKMTHATSDGIVPRITREQMESTVDITRHLSRDSYFRLMDKMTTKFKRNWSIVYNNYHRIVEFVKLDDDDDSDYHTPTNTVTKKLIRQ